MVKRILSVAMILFGIHFPIEVLLLAVQQDAVSGGVSP